VEKRVWLLGVCSAFSVRRARRSFLLKVLHDKAG
jgi:hypothetical protein